MTGTPASKQLHSLTTEKAELLQLLREQRSRQKDAIRRYPRQAGEPVQTSWAQQRLLFIDRLDGGTAAYNIPLTLRMRGKLNRTALLNALDQLVQRHEVLRTVFSDEAGAQRQVIAPTGHVPLLEFDLRSCTAPQREMRLSEHQRAEVQAVFDLYAGPLIRGRLLALSDDEHCLLVTMHHIISDGWSMGILFKELSQLYSAHVNRVAEPLAPLPVQYADYAQWQQEWLQGGVLERQLSYWREQLSGAAPLLVLPTDRSRPVRPSGNGQNVTVILDSRLTAAVDAFALRRQMTPFMVLYAAWSILMARLSGQQDVSTGTPVANRRRSELEGLIGFFVNTLVLRVEVASGLGVGEFLERVKQVTLGAYDHQDAPFEKVVETLQPQRSVSYHPLFQVMFALQSAPQSGLQLPDMSISVELAQDDPAKFDLELSLEHRGAQIMGTLNFATDLFDRSTIERWAGCYQLLLSELIKNDERLVSDLPILVDSERQRIVASFNAEPVPYPHDVLLHEAFETQARRSPHRIAVADGQSELTFAELDRRANQLAWWLLKHGVSPDRPVGLCLERGVESILGVLGILKAGGAYLPLDPRYPAERLRYMLEDCAPAVVLTQGKLRALVSTCCAKVLALDDDSNEMRQQPDSSVSREICGARPEHLAYVIYTSGSTGRPKGVMVEHRNVMSLWQGLEHIYRRVDACERIGVNASITFDASVKQWIQLLSGRTIVLIPEQVRWSPALMLQFLHEQRVDAVDCTPGQLRTWLQGGLLHGDRRHPLRLVLVGGEPIDQALWEQLASSASTTFYNVYGPTESTVDTTFARVTADARAPHIGCPMENRRVCILDPHDQLAPIGVIGELCIGGAGVARGYMGHPELTAAKFCPDAFGGGSSARMYRTGDLARWRADGTIEYLGRNDHQVKIRGFRIELGEIEAVLTRHPAITDAAVIAREDTLGDPRLVAYVVLRDGASPGAIRASLKAALPEWMIPSAFVVLDSLPLTSNGKLDRQALPAPDQNAYAGRPYEPPQGEIEAILSGIWQSLLAVERVGRRDNFFELGGHSFLIMQMMARLDAVGLSVQVRSIFEQPTLAELASTLTRTGRGGVEVPPNLIPAECGAITPEMLPLAELTPDQVERIVATVPGGARNVQDIYPLTPLQEGMLFHHIFDDSGGDTYVVAILLSLASREHLDKLISALQVVVDRHDSLRTAVLWEGLPFPVQVVYRRATLGVTQLELQPGSDPRDELMNPQRQRLDLRQAPLLQLQITPDPGGLQWYCLLQIHHVISDNESLEAMLAEVVGHMEGRVRQLPAPTPYRNHVAQVLAAGRLEQAEAFFRSELGDINEPTAPFDLTDVRSESGQIDQVRQVLEPELAQRVRAHARQLGVSAATLFHAAWSLVIARTTNRDDVVLGAVLLGRLQGGVDTQGTLGMFLNTLPLRLRLRDCAVDALVQQTQRGLVELLSHEQTPLSLAQRCSGIGTAAPLFGTLLNYRHSAVNLDAEFGSTVGLKFVAAHSRTNYPIMLSVDDMGEGFELVVDTDRRIEPRRMMRYMQTALCSLTEALEQTPTALARSLEVLPRDERSELIERFNATVRPYALERTIHGLFEDQVKRTPRAEAVRFGDESITYAELNRRADRLAWYLRDQGVGADQVVGLCMERSIELVVGVLGILKAGAAYLPLDPEYPPERLQYMLEDAGPRVVLTQEKLWGALPATQSQVVAADALLQVISQEGGHPVRAEERGVTSEHLVYLIYTSGSTGRPKGTAMSHRAMVNLIEWHREQWPDSEGRRVLQFAALSFDVAFQEIFSTLCSGATLVLLDEWQRRDARELLSLLSAQSIERLFVPPLMLQSLAEAFQSTGTLPASLRDVITAGEQLRISAEIAKLFEHLAGCRLHNHYGPTESHVVTAMTLAGDPAHWPALPAIGRPIANTRIYVLDEQRQPAPIGVRGEIYIGGANVARGYLNRAELTQQRFVPDLFSTDPHARLYKTGDVGRWRADGVLEYLGRNDDQVKIRGYRIELGEIEAQLAKHAQVREAAVVVREVGGQKRLLAYVTTRGGEVSAEELRTHLGSELPEYMLPSAFVALEQLPLTPSGKLDRRALPEPELSAYASRQYEPPQGEVEQALAQIWQELLNVERVGRHDNFFELGGHSLLATRVMSRMRELFHIDMSLRVIFDAPVLHQLALCITTDSQQPEGLARDLRQQIGAMHDAAVLLKIAELERELGLDLNEQQPAIESVGR